MTGPTSVAAGSAFYLDRVVSERPDEVCFERVFDLQRDSYIREHVVNGYPTLPGTFVPEIAAEAAMALAPGRIPAVFRDAVFSSFLRVYGPDRPVVKKVHARLLSHEVHETRVHVRITSDVVAPGGTLLRPDRVHFEVDVHLRDELPPAPYWEHWDPNEDADPIPDPYHIPNPAVQLTGVFVSTRDTRLHASGRRARFDLRAGADDPAFGAFVVPSILLDGLVRVSVLSPVDEHYLTLAAPASMRRIDLYDTRADLALAAAYPTIELYSGPSHIDLEDPQSVNRCVAVGPDGRVILQIKDTRTATSIMGYIHKDTGEFVTPAQIAEIRRQLRRRQNG
jgi:hypothetical protein